MCIRFCIMLVTHSKRLSHERAHAWNTPLRPRSADPREGVVLYKPVEWLVNLLFPAGRGLNAVCTKEINKNMYNKITMICLFYRLFLTPWACPLPINLALFPFF